MKHALISIFLASVVWGQGPVFEVASVKPSQATREGSSIHNDQGGMRTTGTTLFELIRYAMNAQEFQVIGGPAWIKDARFDVTATNDHVEEIGAGPRDVKGNEARFARVRARLRHLLEERFQLELREEEREVPVYALTVDKGGAKLKQVPDPIGNVNFNRGSTGGSMSAKGATMPRLCQLLSSLVDRPVTDETGLDGAYDVELKYSADMAEGASKDKAPEYPSLFTAVKEQLGLKLTGKKGMATTWVVVRAEKPTEN